MTKPDLMQFLRDKCDESSQSAVAKQLGYSPATISRVLKEDYPDSGIVLAKVEEIYGGISVDCPELGVQTLATCADFRRRAPVTDSFYARMYRACKKCKHNRR